MLGLDLVAPLGEQLEAELRADGLEFTFQPCDITSSAEVAALARDAEERFEALDILVNNAGAILGRPLVETTDEEWDGLLAVNLRGAFLMMRALVPLMAGRQASIVNVASGLGLVGAAGMTAYCASKGGLVLLTKAAALELGPDIRVNVLCPGIIDTPMPRRLAGSVPRSSERRCSRSSHCRTRSSGSALRTRWSRSRSSSQATRRAS